MVHEAVLAFEMPEQAGIKKAGCLMSANFMRGGSDVIGMGRSLAIGMLLLVLLAEPAMAVQPESPWLYLSIAPDQVVSARSAHPDPSPEPDPEQPDQPIAAGPGQG